VKSTRSIEGRQAPRLLRKPRATVSPTNGKLTDTPEEQGGAGQNVPDICFPAFRFAMRGDVLGCGTILERSEKVGARGVRSVRGAAKSIGGAGVTATPG